jgi:hypothetical protein
MEKDKNMTGKSRITLRIPMERPPSIVDRISKKSVMKSFLPDFVRKVGQMRIM